MNARENFDAKSLDNAKDILNASHQREAAAALAAVKSQNNTDQWSSSSMHNRMSPTPSMASSIAPSSSVSNFPPYSSAYSNLPINSLMASNPPSKPGPLPPPMIATPQINPHNVFVPVNSGANQQPPFNRMNSGGVSNAVPVTYMANQNPPQGMQNTPVVLNRPFANQSQGFNQPTGNSSMNMMSNSGGGIRNSPSINSNFSERNSVASVGGYSSSNMPSSGLNASMSCNIHLM